MSVDPAWAEHQRKRWLKPDWKRWMREDAHRFLPPAEQEALRRAQRASAHDGAHDDDPLSESERRALQNALAEIRRELAEVKFEFVWRQICRKYGYNPDQPRVPAGDPDGGQWTSGEGSGGADATGGNSEVLSDATPDNEGKPGAEYAQNRPPGRGPILINGQPVQPTLRQEALLDALEGRSQAAIQKVQTVLPNWRAQESVYSTSTAASTP